MTAADRASFLAAVGDRRHQARAALYLPQEGTLEHYAQAAVDRRAVRDALLAQGLLRIEPRRQKRAPQASSPEPSAGAEKESTPLEALASSGAGTIPSASMAAPALVGDAAALEPSMALPGNQPTEEAHSSTNKMAAGGQN